MYIIVIKVKSNMSCIFLNFILLERFVRMISLYVI